MSADQIIPSNISSTSTADIKGSVFSTPKPLLLYKYLECEHGLSSISCNRIKVSTFDTLNDPYEMLPALVNENGVFAPPELVEEKIRDVIARKNAGIICLSNKLRDPILWAHYAGRHTGMAFEFECSSDQNDLFKITYRRQRITINKAMMMAAHNNRDETFFWEMYARLIATKFSSWKYESEYRFLVRIGETTLQNGLHFKAIPKEHFRRVILGNHCPVQTAALRCILNLAGFDAVKIARARLNRRNQFKMDITTIREP